MFVYKARARVRVRPVCMLFLSPGVALGVSRVVTDRMLSRVVVSRVAIPRTKSPRTKEL